MGCWELGAGRRSRGHQGCQGLGGDVRVSGGHWGLHMKYEDGLLQSTLKNSRQSIADNRT